MKVIVKQLCQYIPVVACNLAAKTAPAAISLNRVEYLKSFDSAEYGKNHTVSYVKNYQNKVFFYSDDLEGWANFILSGASI